jgi:GT2 family glycosyltransferase
LKELPPDSQRGGPFFSVIVLNWNGRHLLEECLSSLEAQSFRDFETIVVDNGSTDGSVEWLKAGGGGEVRLVELPCNLGFAGGNNAGIRASRGTWVAFLNNDTWADPRWLEELHSATVRHGDITFFACKVLSYYRRDEIDTVGHLLYPDGINRGRGRLEKDVGQYDIEEEVLFPSGCAAIYRKGLLDAIGGFDESFFAYGDDTDLGLHARFAGGRCLLAPRAVVYHKYSGTTGAYSLFKAYHVERNRIWILLKYFPLRWILLSPLYTGWRMVCHLVAGRYGKGASGKVLEKESFWKVGQTLFHAYRDALKRFTEVSRMRKAIWTQGEVTPAIFSGWLKRHRLSAREVAWKE